MNTMIEADAWAVGVGTDSATVLLSQGKEENGYCETTKEALLLSVTPAGSYRSVFKPTGLP